MRICIVCAQGIVNNIARNAQLEEIRIAAQNAAVDTQIAAVSTMVVAQGNSVTAQLSINAAAQADALSTAMATLNDDAAVQAVGM